MGTLADDTLEGRGLGSAGYDGALRYVETTLKSYGVEPAGEGGTFQQRVPLRNSVVVEDKSSMKVTSRAGTKTLAYGVDYMLGGDQLREQVAIDNAPVAFVGYGVSAPALGYDDYASSVSVEGKVVAYLSGAPPSLPSNERAYYSSGAVKDAEAAKRGAIGTISFTSPDDPRFRWDVSVATSKQGSFAWIDAQGQPSRGDPALRGSASLNHSGVAALFAGAPTPLAEVFAAAAASTPAGVRPADARLARDQHHPSGRREREPRWHASRAATPQLQSRARRLRRARRSLRARRRDERRRHLQRRARQRFRCCDRAGDRPRL